MNKLDFLKKEDVVLALREAYGNLNLTAKALGISRGLLNDFLVQNPELREERQQIREAILDEAEDQLRERIKVSDSLLIFFLRTQGKARGYESNNTLSGPGGGPVQVQVDARALIKAMRDGFNGEETSDTENDNTNLLPDGE